MKSTEFNLVQKSQNINKEIISNTNQSNEQEIINYNQINSSIEKSNSSTTQLQKNKIEIEQKNIQMLIFQRSLYIMKQRFEQNRKEIQLVYDKYKSTNYKSLECISTQNLFECYKELFQTNQINLYQYENFNDLCTADLVSGTNEDKFNKVIKDLVQFTRKKVEKYNEKFYENKMKKKKLKEEEEKKNLSELEKNDVSDKVKIVHKNKRGEIISDFQKISEANKKVVINELIYTVTEEDMTILTSNNLLYHGVIPLIIADFIQEYMEKNIKIGIIITNRNFYHEKEDLILEQNIKVLYDKEIMKLYSNLNKIDPNEEKDEDLRKLLFESNSIDNKIKLYNELIMENSKKGEDITHLTEMIKKLKEQKILYQKKISEINTKKISLTYNMTTSNSQSYSKTINTNKKITKINTASLKSQNISKESKQNQSFHNSKNNSKVHLKLKTKKLSKTEIRNNTLKEIFAFYCKQHSFLGRTPTFGDLLTREELMNLSEFIKFCLDFKILVKKDTITRIFRQDIKDATLMNYEEFIKCIKKMAILMHEEKKGYKLDKINFYELKKQELIEKEKRKKNKKEKNINADININNEEEKNTEQNMDKMIMTNEENNNNIGNNNAINENQNKEENINKENNNENNNNINNNVNKNIEEEKKEDDKNNLQENNIENNRDINLEEKKENNEEKDIERQKSKSKSGSKKKKKLKKEHKKNLMTETKEDLEEKISKLKTELKILEQKTEIQIVEDFYSYLELDDVTKYHKKMIGYIRPFQVREDDTRNPEKNVKNPIKFNKQSIMRKYEYLIQRKEDIKKQKELQVIKERDIQFEERKKKFNRKLKKLEKDYDSKIKKDNYIQIKKNEEDYLKEKNSKLTWKFIQNNDYQAFLLNDQKNINNNLIPSQLKDIFNNKNDYNNVGDDDDFINNIYSNKNPNLKNSFNKSKKSSQENSRYIGNESYSKFSDLSID